MSKKVFASAAVLVLLTSGLLAYAQSTSADCNNHLIAGNYGFAVRGQKLAGPGLLGPQIGVAMTHFDGEGNFTQIAIA